MKTWIPLLAALAMSAPIYAEPAAAPATQTSAMSEGVVRKIDATNAKITLRHGPIANLDMPGMTMVFRVQPPELLDAVKVGDKVRFHAEDINGAFTVTAIQPAP
jgi:Cu(I)/Ag(I) efflux system protein CusF